MRGTSQVQAGGVRTPLRVLLHPDKVPDDGKGAACLGQSHMQTQRTVHRQWNSHIQPQTFRRNVARKGRQRGTLQLRHIGGSFNGQNHAIAVRQTGKSPPALGTG